MRKISKKIFLDMFSLGILLGNDKHVKIWTITSKNKPSKRKGRYVSDDAWRDYQKYLKNNLKLESITKKQK